MVVAVPGFEEALTLHQEKQQRDTRGQQCPTITDEHSCTGVSDRGSLVRLLKALSPRVLESP